MFWINGFSPILTKMDEVQIVTYSAENHSAVRRLFSDGMLEHRKAAVFAGLSSTKLQALLLSVFLLGSFCNSAWLGAPPQTLVKNHHSWFCLWSDRRYEFSASIVIWFSLTLHTVTFLCLHAVKKHKILFRNEKKIKSPGIKYIHQHKYVFYFFLIHYRTRAITTRGFCFFLPHFSVQFILNFYPSNIFFSAISQKNRLFDTI